MKCCRDCIAGDHIQCGMSCTLYCRRPHSVWNVMYIVLQATTFSVECHVHCACILMLYCSWFQTFAMSWMLYAFFWVIPQHLNFICRRFRALCLFHVRRQVGACRTYLPMKMEQTECSEMSAYKIQTPGNHPTKACNIVLVSIAGCNNSASHHCSIDSVKTALLLISWAAVKMVLDSQNM